MNNNIDINRIHYVAIIGSILFLIFIIELIRRKKVKEAFSLIWLSLSIVFIIFSIWRDGLERLADFLGIGYAPSALFLILLIGIFLLLIQFSVLISKLSRQNIDLTQEVGILKMELKKIKEKIKEDLQANDK